MARSVGTPIRVREARPDEHDAVGELTVAVYAAGDWADEGYRPVLRDVAGRAAQTTVLVAVRDDRLLGTVTLAAQGGPYAEHAGPSDAVVRMLVVDPAARGEGVGELLVRESLDRARAAGCTHVRLSTQPDMTAAHRLYERLGFVRTPEGDWRPVPHVQLLAYELALGDFCDACGQRLVGGREHPDCRAARELEPPRYCPDCRRRLVVQVVPTGWTARCVEHGVRAG